MEAEEVVLAPLPLKGQGIDFRAGIEYIIKKGLKHPLTPGDRVVVPDLVYNGKLLEFEL